MTIESLSHDIDFLQSLAGRVIQAEGFVKGTVASLPQFDNNVNAALLFEGGRYRKHNSKLELPHRI